MTHADTLALAAYPRASAARALEARNPGDGAARWDDAVDESQGRAGCRELAALHYCIRNHLD